MFVDLLYILKFPRYFWLTYYMFLIIPLYKTSNSLNRTIWKIQNKEDQTKWKKVNSEHGFAKWCLSFRFWWFFGISFAIFKLTKKTWEIMFIHNTMLIVLLLHVRSSFWFLCCLFCSVFNYCMLYFVYLILLLLCIAMGCIDKLFGDLLAFKFP